MTATEIAAIVIGGYLGYLAVGVVMQAMSGQQNSQPSSVDTESLGSAHPLPQATREPLAAHWYEMLGVTPTASEAEITQSYRRLMSQYHPDKVASLGPELHDLALQKTQEITVAYEQAMRLRS